jgi:hypothetical protein
VAKAIAYTLVEEEGSLDLSEFSARGAGGAAFGEPRFSRSVVALEEIYGMGVLAGSGCLEATEMAAQHFDELRRVFKQIDADEGGVVPSVGMS